jgi:hypothetical protein
VVRRGDRRWWWCLEPSGCFERVTLVVLVSSDEENCETYKAHCPTTLQHRWHGNGPWTYTHHGHHLRRHKQLVQCPKQNSVSHLPKWWYIKNLLVILLEFSCTYCRHNYRYIGKKVNSKQTKNSILLYCSKL